MNGSYRFRQDEIDSIVKRFGRSFYERAAAAIEAYGSKWSLTNFKLIPSYSANLVFTCEAGQDGPAVLKIGRPSSSEIMTEYNALNEYNGVKFCSVYKADFEDGVLLEACIQPGIPLRDERDLETRLSVFSSLYNGLHIAPAIPESYPTYLGWVTRITEYMSRRNDCKELYAHMKKAEGICLSIAEQYAKQMLLHGDFHHDNILLGSDGRYVIIDPKGVVGDPVFDVPRFILNEFDDDITPALYDKINFIIYSLEKKLNIPNDILKKCLYVETAMGECWSVESGASAEEYEKLLQNVVFAESILKGNLANDK